MPIVGLTTKTEFGAGLPLIARLYKGDEKPEQGNRPGKDLDYFRVEFEPQFAHLQELWTDMYGDAPEEFEPVFLAAATVDEAFSSWKEEWTATTMLHRCDGEYQKNWYNVATQQYSTAKVKCVSDDEKPCGCKAVGRLNMILPEFIEAAGVLGYVSVSTHSLNDILTVYRYLADIERIAGKLTGIPFIFGRAAREISAPKQVKKNGQYVNDGRIKTTKSLFYVHVAQDFTREQLLPILSGAVRPELPAPKPDVELAKQRLGAGERRIGGGYVPGVAGLDPQPTLSETVDAEISIVEPEKPVEASEPLKSPENAPDPLVAPKTAIQDTAPKADEIRQFAVKGFETYLQANGKSFYKLDCNNMAVVNAYSRKVFREFGYSEDAIKDWDKEGFKLGFQTPFTVSAKWKTHEDKPGGYWAYEPVKAEDKKDVA